MIVSDASTDICGTLSSSELVPSTPMLVTWPVLGFDCCLCCELEAFLLSLLAWCWILSFSFLRCLFLLVSWLHSSCFLSLLYCLASGVSCFCCFLFHSLSFSFSFGLWHILCFLFRSLLIALSNPDILVSFSGCLSFGVGSFYLIPCWMQFSFRQSYFFISAKKVSFSMVVWYHILFMLTPNKKSCFSTAPKFFELALEEKNIGS